MLETCIGPSFLINWIKSVSRWFHYTDILWCTVNKTLNTKCRLWSASWGWASNARNMLRPLFLNKLNKKCITLVSLYRFTTMHGQQNIKFVSNVLAVCTAAFVSRWLEHSDSRYSRGDTNCNWFGCSLAVCSTVWRNVTSNKIILAKNSKLGADVACFKAGLLSRSCLKRLEEATKHPF
jgi:hypothetical protein